MYRLVSDVGCEFYKDMAIVCIGSKSALPLAPPLTADAPPALSEHPPQPPLRPAKASSE